MANDLEKKAMDRLDSDIAALEMAMLMVKPREPISATQICAEKMEDTT